MKIKKSALQFVLGAARNVYPKEFSGLLRGTKEQIEEVLIIPATVYGDTFSMQRRDMVPIDRTIIGSVHSHPGRNFSPSQEDLRFFKKSGFVHLIVSYPYNSIENVHSYDANGKFVKLESL